MKTFLTIAVFATLLPVMTFMMTGCEEFDEAIQMNRTQQNHRPKNEPKNSETAYFAAGCFWGVEAAFRRVEGVTATAVGYMGGRVPNPTYQQVCTGKTGHAETVKVEFDPEKVSYEHLLDVFWKVHNPTTLNRQGPDVGSQYRSAVFVEDETHYKAAVASRQVLAQSGRFAKPIVTEIKKAGPFYPAEDYHQQYLEKQGKASCTITLQ